MSRKNKLKSLKVAQSKDDGGGGGWCSECLYEWLCDAVCDVVCDGVV